jgi:hypothetical protein
MTLSDRLAEWDAVAVAAQSSGWYGPKDWYDPTSVIEPIDAPEDMAYIALASPARFRALLDVARAAEAALVLWLDDGILAEQDALQMAQSELSAALARLREVEGE